MQGTVSLRSVHGKFLSAQPDGRAEWNRDVALAWELFNVEPRNGGKIALKGFHGMYVSAQLTVLCKSIEELHHLAVGKSSRWKDVATMLSV